MPQSGQNLSASRWATTNRNTSTFKKHYGGHDYTPTTPSLVSRSPSPSKLGTINNQPKLTPAQSDFQSRTLSHQIFTRYARRLKWKSTSLLLSHQRTLSLLHNTHVSPSNHIGGIDFPMQAEEPETMFKIDFFEFYTILEHTLVNLLKVFGMEVSPVYGTDARYIDGDGMRQVANHAANESVEWDSLIGDSKTIQKSRHSYHANVLLALDKESCPLKPIIGQGSVRDYLGIAKEWRNKWKNIEEDGKDERVDGLVGSRYEKLINELRLEEMLKEIVVAVEQGGILAEHTLRQFHEELNRDGLASVSMDIDQRTDDLVEMLPGDIMEWD